MLILFVHLYFIGNRMELIEVFKYHLVQCCLHFNGAFKPLRDIVIIQVLFFPLSICFFNLCFKNNFLEEKPADSKKAQIGAEAGGSFESRVQDWPGQREIPQQLHLLTHYPLTSNIILGVVKPVSSPPPPETSFLASAPTWMGCSPAPQLPSLGLLFSFVSFLLGDLLDLVSSLFFFNPLAV